LAIPLVRLKAVGELGFTLGGLLLSAAVLFATSFSWIVEIPLLAFWTTELFRGTGGGAPLFRGIGGGTALDFRGIGGGTLPTLDFLVTASTPFEVTLGLRGIAGAALRNGFGGAEAVAGVGADAVAGL